MKNLILILLIPFLIWQSNVNTCYLTVDDNLWEVSSPYGFNLQYLENGIHDIIIQPICDNPDAVYFEINCNNRSNKKWFFLDYSIQNMSDPSKFNALEYRERIKK